MKKMLMLAVFLMTSNAFAMKPGTYLQKNDEDTIDVLTVLTDGTVSLEEKRQVGLDENSPIPYPTNCTYKYWGKIVDENSQQVLVKLDFVHLVNSKNSKNSEYCQQWVEQANYNIVNGANELSLFKDDYTKQ